jgi:S1-C subfamily serine protease
MPLKRTWTSLLQSLLLLALLAAPGVARSQVDPAVLKAEQDRVAVVDRCVASTVAVFSPGGQGGGSGVVISPDGYALSNFHVTNSTGKAMQCGMSDGKLYDAVIVGLDPTGDVALIKLLGRNDFLAAELGNSDQVRVGDWCFTVGNPFLLATDFQPTVAYGVISGVHRYQYPAGTILEYADCLQADAAINPGNSGGPMFDDQGRLIGINGRGSFEKRGRVNVGVGYAISINQIKNFLGHLKSGRIVDHATLGAVVRSDAKRRVLVDDILENSDAYRRGLRYGDEIVAFGGRDIATVNEFKNVLGIYPRDWRVPLSFRRKGQRYDVMVRLRGVHGAIELEGMIDAEGKGEHPVPEHDGEEPGKEPGGKPGEEPLPIPKPGGHKAAPMPEIVKQHFTAKSSYVNYYFNRVERERVWAAAVSRGNYEACRGVWSVSGKNSDGEDFRLEFSDAEGAIKLPSGELRVPLGGGLSTHLEPPGSGGLLVSLSLWRRMLLEGPEKFGQVSYLGKMPIAGREGLCDVLEASHDDVECRFMFDAGNGSLVAMEMFPETDSDPCELYFDDYQELGGQWLPGRIEVRHGDGYLMTFSCKQYEFKEDGDAAKD